MKHIIRPQKEGNKILTFLCTEHAICIWKGLLLKIYFSYVSALEYLPTGYIPTYTRFCATKLRGCLLRIFFYMLEMYNKFFLLRLVSNDERILPAVSSFAYRIQKYQSI